MDQQQPDDAQVDPPALVVPPSAEQSEEEAAELRAAVSEPDKVLRIATMVRELLDETRTAPPDERGRVMLRNAYEKAVAELSDVLSDDLKQELKTLAPPMGEVPTESELRVAQALLVGWLEGLFHGIQAAMWAQQMAARAQFDELRRRSLPPGMQGPPGAGPGQPPQERPSGTYL
jgi:Bacterial proteasome activator